jgi:phage-related minor tail protein
LADRIKGITIEIGGETTKLQASLKGVNSTINSTKSQLRDVEKLLKLDPTNTELLRQKQKLLGDQVKATSDKLEELKKAQAQMDAAGVDKSSQEYMALQREIIATEQELKNAEKEARNFNATLEKVSATATKVSEGAAKAAEKTRALSTAAAGALTGIAGLAYKAATNADDLNTLAKQTGFTTAELQKMQYAADRIDVSMETITGASQKMVNKLRSSEKTFTELGIATRDASGNLRSSTDIFYDTIKYLSTIENETERDAVAMSIFGKSANELAGIIDDGGQALKEFGDEAEQAGLILDQETLDGLNEVNDEIDKLKAQGAASIAKAGAAALQALTPLIEKVALAIEKVLNFIAQLTPQQMQVIMTILAVVAAISPLLSIISALSAAIAFLASPIGIVIAIIAALIAIGIALYKHWDEIKAKAIEFVNGVKAGFEQLKTDVTTAVENLKTNIATTWENIKTSITRPIEQAWQTVSGIVDKIKDMFNFSLSFPHIKLPHFSWTWSDLGVVSIPHISVEWYKKAYDEPYMFTRPTVIGNRGFGDGNGAEMVYGKDNLMNDIKTAMGTQPIELTVYSVLDGRIVGKSVTKFQNGLARAVGG